MADELRSIVQRMIDAGESEDNIATVVRSYQPPPVATGRLAAHALSGDPGGYPEGVDPTQSTTSQIGRGLQPLAHPQSVTDIGRLLMAPVDTTRSVMAYAPAALEQAGSMARVAGRLISRTHLHPVDAALDFQVTKPFKALSKLVTIDPEPTPNPLANMGSGPSGVSGPGPVGPSGPPEPFGVTAPKTSELGADALRQLKRQGYSDETIAKIQQATASQSSAPTVPSGVKPPPATPYSNTVFSNAQATAASIKPNFTAQEVLKIKMLIQQGLSQDKAIELVKSAVQ